MTEAEPLGGRYKIISQLGAGGFGQTFLAEDLHLPGNPICVVKQLKPQTKDTASLTMARRLFDTEAKVLYQLGDHDQIPRLLAHFEQDQEFYLAQELIDGKPLTHELVAGEPWSEGQVIGLLQDILNVLAFVHQQQVIHRDIKPPNLIRRSSDGKVVLIDFGAVKQVSTQTVNSEHPTNLTISIGTQGYMPNEQLAGIPRFSSDVYALGMLAIQALTGVHPKRLKEDPKTGEISWHKHALNVNRELSEIIDKMVRYDFRDRYLTAVEALEALQSLPAEILDSVPPPQPLSEVQDVTIVREQTPSASAIEPESEIDQSPTNLWLPTEPLPEAGTSNRDTDATSLLSPQAPIQDSIRLESAPIRNQFLKFLPVVGGFVALGVSILLAKTFFSPFLASRTGNLVETPAKSPTTSSTSPSTPGATTQPKRQQAMELLDEADRLRKLGDYQQALSLYDQSIALRPKVPRAYWGRCDSLNQLKRPAEAVVACNDALDLKPNYGEALWSKGQGLEQQKLTIEALQLYERATEIKPDFAEAWISYGISLQKYGRSEEAINALDKAIALRRNSATAWTTRGEALLNLGRVEQAIASLDKGLQIQPDNPDAIKLRQQAQAQLGR